MAFVPWSRINTWHCNGCGICCKEFEVVLTFKEWLEITKTYGFGVTKAGLNKFFIRKRPDGSCIFLYKALDGKWLCGLQRNKPLACKLWPFKILKKPKYGNPREAAFEYGGQRFYVYVDAFCPGIIWGTPSIGLVYKIIPEFIELALGIRQTQLHSTMPLAPRFYIIKTKRDYRLI